MLQPSSTGSKDNDSLPLDQLVEEYIQRFQFFPISALRSYTDSKLKSLILEAVRTGVPIICKSEDN